LYFYSFFYQNVDFSDKNDIKVQKNVAKCCIIQKKALPLQPFSGIRHALVHIGEALSLYRVLGK